MAKTLTYILNKLTGIELDKKLKTAEQKIRRRGRAIEYPDKKYKSVLSRGSALWREAVNLFEEIEKGKLNIKTATDEEKRLRIKQLETFANHNPLSSIENIRKTHRRFEKDAGRKLSEGDVYMMRKSLESIPESTVSSDYVYESVLELANGATHAQIIQRAKELYAQDQGLIRQYAEEAENFTPIY